MAPNASMKSPRMPPGPPTSAVSPSGASASTSRMSTTAASSSSPSDVAMGTTTWAALPSSAGIGPTTPSASTFSTCLRSSTYCPIVAWSCWVRPPSRSNTTIVGSDSLPMNLVYSSCASVDSALSGRKAALSFSWTLASFPAYDPSGPPTNSQRSTTTSGRIQRLERGDRWDLAISGWPFGVRCRGAGYAVGGSVPMLPERSPGRPETLRFHNRVSPSLGPTPAPCDAR